MSHLNSSRTWSCEGSPGHADIVVDYTWMGCPELGDRRFDVVITNPPFNQAMNFVVESLKRADIVVMFLRLGWLASGPVIPALQLGS